jgi:hypothetical protein
MLQGIRVLLMGFILLSRGSEWAQRQLDKFKTRYPKFAEKYDEAEARAERLWKLWFPINNSRQRLPNPAP